MTATTISQIVDQSGHAMRASGAVLTFIAGLILGAAGGMYWLAYRLRRVALEAEYGKVGASLLRGR